MNGSQQELRQEHRADDRERERDAGRYGRRAERGAQILADQQRRDADADRSEIGVAEPQRLPELEVLPLSSIDGPQLGQRRSRDELGEIAARRQHPTFARGIRGGDSQPFDVDDRGEGDILGIEARFENGPEARVFAQRPVRGGRVGIRGHDLARAMKNRVAHKLGARGTGGSGGRRPRRRST